MDFNQFTGRVQEVLENKIRKGEEVKLVHSIKNNGEEKVGISICCPGKSAAPTLYLEEFYIQYQKGVNIYRICEQLYQIYIEAQKCNRWTIKEFFDFERMKKKIVFKLINATLNKKILDEIPYQPYLDLVIVYYILLENTASGTVSMMIKNQHLEAWGKTAQEIHALAVENTPKLLPGKCYQMEDMIPQLFSGMKLESAQNLYDEICDEIPPMYILSNEASNLGASVILYPGVLEKVYVKLGESYYLLPSSIHETIIVPESHCMDRKTMDEMVTDINETELEPEEVLSNHVYYYDHKVQCLTM